MPSFPFLQQFCLVGPYPFERLPEYGGRGVAEHGFNPLQTDQHIQPATGQVYVGRQVILFPQLNPVFVPESVFGRHAQQGIVILAIPQRPLQILAGQVVTPHSDTE